MAAACTMQSERVLIVESCCVPLTPSLFLWWYPALPSKLCSVRGHVRRAGLMLPNSRQHGLLGVGMGIKAAAAALCVRIIAAPTMRSCQSSSEQCYCWTTQAVQEWWLPTLPTRWLPWLAPSWQQQEAAALTFTLEALVAAMDFAIGVQLMLAPPPAAGAAAPAASTRCSQTESAADALPSLQRITAEAWQHLRRAAQQWEGSRGVLVGPLLRGGALLRWLRGFHVLGPESLEALLLLADHMMCPEVSLLDKTRRLLAHDRLMLVLPPPDGLLDEGVVACKVRRAQVPTRHSACRHPDISVRCGAGGCWRDQYIHNKWDVLQSPYAVPATPPL
jgi:hypothetical protein